MNVAECTNIKKYCHKSIGISNNFQKQYWYWYNLGTTTTIYNRVGGMSANFTMLGVGEQSVSPNDTIHKKLN